MRPASDTAIAAAFAAALDRRLEKNERTQYLADLFQIPNDKRAGEGPAPEGVEETL